MQSVLLMQREYTHRSSEMINKVKIVVKIATDWVKERVVHSGLLSNL